MSDQKMQISDRELLIRIDERLSAFVERLIAIENRPSIPMSDHLYLVGKVKHMDLEIDKIKEKQHLIEKVEIHDIEIEKLKNWKTTVLGITMGVSIVFGFLSNLLIGQIRSILGIK